MISLYYLLVHVCVCVYTYLGLAFFWLVNSKGVYYSFVIKTFVVVMVLIIIWLSAEC